jgi:hypothetical protein
MVLRLGGAVGIAALAVAVAAPVPVHAAEIDRSDPYLTYQASPGEASVLTVTVRDGQVRFSDPAVDVDNFKGGADCSGKDTGTVTCKLPSGMRVKVELGDGDDQVEVLAGAAKLEGDSGADTLIGGPGADQLGGGRGDDLLQGRGGTDAFEPGDGFDKIDYFDHTAPVVANFDGIANDGSAGENELVPADAEMLVGGQGADRLTAASTGSYLHGSPGGDTLYGGPGPDTIYGGKDDDVLNGGGGVDRFFADIGSDVVYAADGNAESVACGDGFDYFQADALDTLIGCEQAGDPPAPAVDDLPDDAGSGSGPGGGTPPPPPDVGRTVTVDPRRRHGLGPAARRRHRRSRRGRHDPGRVDRRHDQGRRRPDHGRRRGRPHPDRPVPRRRLPGPPDRRRQAGHRARSQGGRHVCARPRRPCGRRRPAQGPLPPPLGLGPRQLPDARAPRVGDGARHDLADRGPLRRNAHARQARRRRRERLRREEDEARPRGQELPGASLS